MRGRLSGVVCPVLDARRGEVYAALYRLMPDEVEVVEPEFAVSPEKLISRLQSRAEPVTLFGQVDCLPAGERGKVWSEEVILPDALAVAQLARRRFARRGGDDLPSLRPIYVRMSYAEERYDIDLGLR